MKIFKTRTLTFRGIEIIAAAGALIVAIIVGILSFAWFADGNKSTAAGMKVVVRDSTLTEYGADYAFSVIDNNDPVHAANEDGMRISIPGTSAIYKVALLNESDDEINVASIGFEEISLFSGTKSQADAKITSNHVSDYDEFPRFYRESEEDEYSPYYFGTQLSARMIRIEIYSKDAEGSYFHNDPNSEFRLDSIKLNYTDQDGTVASDIDTLRPAAPLLNDNLDTDKLELFGPAYSAAQNSSNINDTEIQIGAGEMIVFYVQVLFNNQDESQDEYRGFSFGGNSTKERCKRTIYVEKYDLADEANSDVGSGD